MLDPAAARRRRTSIEGRGRAAPDALRARAAPVRGGRRTLAAVRADARGAIARCRADDPPVDARGDDRLADRHGARRPPAPFFAPVSAIITLGLTQGERGRRAIEVILGVTLGIAVADLLVIALGAGWWQLAVVVSLSMSVALLLGSGQMFAQQAAVSAALVATLQPPDGGVEFARALDALVGGSVALAVSALVLPAHPAGWCATAAAPVLAELAGVLEDIAAALEARSRQAAQAALRRGRGIDELARNLDDALVGRARDRAARAAAARHAGHRRPLRRRGRPDRPRGPQRARARARRPARDRPRRERPARAWRTRCASSPPRCARWRRRWTTRRGRTRSASRRSAPRGRRRSCSSARATCRCPSSSARSARRRSTSCAASGCPTRTRSTPSAPPCARPRTPRDAGPRAVARPRAPVSPAGRPGTSTSSARRSSPAPSRSRSAGTRRRRAARG